MRSHSRVHRPEELGERRKAFEAELAAVLEPVAKIVGISDGFAISTAHQLQMLQTGSLDIGFLRLPIFEQTALEVMAVHREPFVLVVPSSHKLAKRKRVPLGEASGENFVMNERSYAPGFYDLIFGMLRDARIVPNVSQTAADFSTVISLVGAQMGVAILPASAVKHSVASVVACDIVGAPPMAEIALVCNKRVRAPIVDRFRSFALRTPGPFKKCFVCQPELTSVASFCEAGHVATIELFSSWCHWPAICIESLGSDPQTLRKRRLGVSMEQGPDKVLVVEADASLRERVGKLLADAGYQVCTEFAATLRTVLASVPDVIVLGANPPQLDCCDLLADVKRSEHARQTRVIILAPGGAAERIRGLDLGADDVVSLPFEDRELLARVRAQLREKRPEDELRESVRQERKSRREARHVVHALNQERRTLHLWVSLLILFVVLATGDLAFLYWRSQRQNVRVYTALAKLQTGIAGERELVEQARQARSQVEQDVTDSTEAQRQLLKRQSKELRDKLGTADASQVSQLERQLRAANERLQRLEAESTVAQNVIRSYSASVCLLHVVVGFRDKRSGLTLRYASMASAGSTLPNGSGVQVQLGGIGPEVRIDAFGTGFLVAADGSIVTNHHVVEPWWKNDDITELLKQAVELEPMVAEMTAYFPGVSRGVPVVLRKISSDADVAVVAGKISGLKLKLLAMDDRPKAAVSGQPIVLIGYPTGIDAILARTSEDAVRSIAANSNGDSKGLMTELARRNLIRPVNTQGHIGDVLTDKIVYDAQTTSGGSGGPLFNAEGKVIAINVAMLRDFGGSNFAIPVRYAKPLLPR